MLYFPLFAENEIVPLEEVKAGVEDFRDEIKNTIFYREADIEDGNETIITLLLVKYVYYKIILGDDVKAEKLLLVTTDNFVRTNFYNSKTNIIDSHVITDNIIDDDNNIIISDNDLEKCWQILMFFNCLQHNYSSTNGFPYGVNEIQNYDKFVTKKFFHNITQIDAIKITESCDYCATFAPIMPAIKNRLSKHKSDKNSPIEKFCQHNNTINDIDLVIDWLFKNCEHVETFEMGLFAATSQALYLTEGFDAFTKFLSYAESLNDENRIRLINILIKLFNNLSEDGWQDNNFCVIPKIITGFDLCNKFFEYPESLVETVFNAAKEPTIFEDFRIKSHTNFQFFIEGIKNVRDSFENITNIQDSMLKSHKNCTIFTNRIKNFRNNPENIVDIQAFGREKTVPMQAIINEYDKLAENKEE